MEFDPGSITILRAMVHEYKRNGPNSQRAEATPKRVVEDDWFWGKIISYSSTAPHRATYGAQQQQRTPTGWQDHPNKRTVSALNSCEAFNSSSGTMGNSINHASNYPSSSDWFQFVTGNPIVWVIGEYDSTGKKVYSFSFPNAEQGAC